jgi:DNA-binding NarL/FixJ family response regulator
MVDKLSPMQRECVRLTQDGLRNAEIAARLGISGRESRTLAAVALYRYENRTHTAALVGDGREEQPRPIK